MYPLSTASATSFLSTLLLFLHLTASFPSNDMSNLSNCNRPCPVLSNSTTFDNVIFSLASNHETLTFFYGCKKLSDSVEENSKFSCPMPGDSEEGFFKFGDHPSGDRCRTSFQVPFLWSWKQQLQAEGSSLLGKVSKDGFDVSYRNPYGANCQKCYKHSGRQCGFDGKVPICICNDQLCPGKLKSILILTSQNLLVSLRVW